MSFFKESEEKKRIKKGIAWFTAAKKGETGTMRVMLEQDKDLLNSRDAEEKTAFMVAAIALKGEAAVWLKDQGAAINAQDYRGYTVLHHLVTLSSDSDLSRYHYNHNQIKFYLKHGLDPNVCDADGNSPLHLAAIHKKNRQMADSLFTGGADQLVRNRNGFTAAELATKYSPKNATVFLENVRRYEVAQRGTPIVTPKPEPIVEPLPVPAADWVKTGENEVAHVQEKTVIGYCLTEIFNFRNQTYICLARNTDTGVETQSQRDFSDFSSRNILEEAAMAYQKITGVTPEMSVSTIPKVKLQPVR